MTTEAEKRQTLDFLVSEGEKINATLANTREITAVNNLLNLGYLICDAIGSYSTDRRNAVLSSILIAGIRSTSTCEHFTDKQKAYFGIADIAKTLDDSRSKTVRGNVVDAMLNNVRNRGDLEYQMSVYQKAFELGIDVLAAKLSVVREMLNVARSSPAKYTDLANEYVSKIKNQPQQAENV